MSCLWSAQPTFASHLLLRFCKSVLWRGLPGICNSVSQLQFLTGARSRELPGLTNWDLARKAIQCFVWILDYFGSRLRPRSTRALDVALLGFEAAVHSSHCFNYEFMPPQPAHSAIWTLKSLTACASYPLLLFRDHGAFSFALACPKFWSWVHRPCTLLDMRLGAPRSYHAFRTPPPSPSTTSASSMPFLSELG